MGDKEQRPQFPLLREFGPAEKAALALVLQLPLRFMHLYYHLQKFCSLIVFI